MARLLNLIASTFNAFAAAVLLLLASILIFEACWEILRALIALGSEGAPSGRILDSVGLIVIAFAVMEVSKFIVEEQVVRRRELRSAREARHSLTKFLTIIVIALSLEAIVMVFKANRGDAANAIYPALLLAVVALTLVGLGAYQWFSNIVEPSQASVTAEAQIKSAEQKAKAEHETKRV